VFLSWWLAVSLVATVVVSLAYGSLASSSRSSASGTVARLPRPGAVRFQLALNTGTVESLIERLDALEDEPGAASTQEAAQILVGLAAALSIHDKITRGHAERVRAYSAMLGAQLGLSKESSTS
jgi:HD-GYP domain-containing protein (c-di-GMP phosphodiesterase class II)